MILYGLCLNRLKTAIRQIDKKIENDKSNRIIIEAYFLTEDAEIRKHFNIRNPKKIIQEDLNDMAKVLTRYSHRNLNFEFIDDRGGLCLCYYPKGKQ